MTYVYKAPERLEDDWVAGVRTDPDEMLVELEDDVRRLLERVESGPSVVAVQGRISDYKSWLAAALAVRLADNGVDTAVMVPQKANRESVVDKLHLFRSAQLEHPGRLDLCIWEPWKDRVGYVDKTTCESNGCPYYLASKEDVESRTDDAMSAHALRGDSVELDKDELKALGEMQDFCPAQLYLQARDTEYVAGAVHTATYAKAFTDAAISHDDPLDADVLLMDEAHTVAASPDVALDDVDIGGLLGAVTTLEARLSGAAESWAQEAHRDTVEMMECLSHWADLSMTTHVTPEDVFGGATVSLSDSFDTLERVDARMLQSIHRNTRLANWADVRAESSVRTAIGKLRSLLSKIHSYNEGEADFIHNLYTEGGRKVNEMAFRRLDEPTVGGVTAGDVYAVWQAAGTHPAILDRWGPLLDRYIEALWDGRNVARLAPPDATPIMPVDKLREITGADTIITFSATHNEVSDPTRDPTELRPTRHDVVTAPLCLRSQDTGRKDYDGSDTTNPATPWFRSMVQRAAERSGDTLAVVPINKSNSEKWAGLPVDAIETDDGWVNGIVPNSRGAIGEKGLESMNVDTVLCGVQVQDPASTARRVVRWWELLAPRRSSALHVMQETWRLLAQHAVSGTIQAGGRFRWSATNFVFERPELFELAGFEVRRGTPDDAGFVGEFCALVRDHKLSWERDRTRNRVRKTVRYLTETKSKSPTPRQMVSEYARIYGTTRDEAREALKSSQESGDVKYDGSRYHT